MNHIVRKEVRLVLRVFSLIVLLISSAYLRAEEINIGLISSQTGYGAASGKSTRQGAELAIHEINAAGGILGKKLVLHVEDNQSEPKNGITALYKLISSNNIVALVGPNWTEFAEPVALLANSKKIPMITPTGHTPSLVKDKPYVFTLLIPAADAIRPLTMVLLKKQFKKLHILYSQNTFYEMLTLAISENMRGTIPVETELVASDNLDFKANIAKLKLDPHSAIIAFLQENGPVSTFVKQARTAGIGAERIFLGPVMKDDNILKRDTQLTEGISYFEYVFTIRDEFQKKFKNMFGDEARYDSTLSYDAIYMLKNSIEKCGIQADKLISCIPTSLTHGESGPIAFDHNKDRISDKPVTEVLRMHNGIGYRVDEYQLSK